MRVGDAKQKSGRGETDQLGRKIILTGCAWPGRAFCDRIRSISTLQQECALYDSVNQSLLAGFQAEYVMQCVHKCVSE